MEGDHAGAYGERRQRKEVQPWELRYGDHSQGGVSYCPRRQKGQGGDQGEEVRGSMCVFVLGSWNSAREFEKFKYILQHTHTHIIYIYILLHNNILYIYVYSVCVCVCVCVHT